MKERKTNTIINLSELRPNAGQIPGVPRNPRKWSDDALEWLKGSITEDPELLDARPLLVYPIMEEHEQKYCVIGGNMRLAACTALEHDAAPCYVYPKNTPAEKLRRVAMKDNVPYGENDEDILKEWPEDLLEDLHLINVDEIDIADEKEPEQPKEYNDDEQAEDDGPDIPVQPGDVWELGEHRVMCGDATKAEDVERLTDGVPADLVFTDPPYGMKKEAVGVLNDNLNFDDLLAFNKKWAAVTFAALKSNGSWYCWGISEPLMDIYAEIIKPMQKRKEVTFRNLLTWYKGAACGQLSPDMRGYAKGTEKCLFVMKGNANVSGGKSWGEADFFEGYEPIRAYLAGELKKSGLTKKDIINATSTSITHYFTRSQWQFPTRENYEAMRELSNGAAFLKSYDELEAQFSKARAAHVESMPYFNNTHDNFNDVWLYESNKFGEIRNEVLEEQRQAGGHATPKPLFICRRGILTSSREGEIVLDVFGGSGSTLIACEQTGRRCRMLELDPHYCSVIIKRWQRFTGKEAHKIK